MSVTQEAPTVVGKDSTRTSAPVLGGIDHLAVSNVDAEMGHVGGSAPEEDGVAGFERVVRSQLGGRVVLVPGDPGQLDPGDPRPPPSGSAPAVTPRAAPPIPTRCSPSSPGASSSSTPSQGRWSSTPSPGSAPRSPRPPSSTAAPSASSSKTAGSPLPRRTSTTSLGGGPHGPRQVDGHQRSPFARNSPQAGQRVVFTLASWRFGAARGGDRRPRCCTSLLYCESLTTVSWICPGAAMPCR